MENKRKVVASYSLLALLGILAHLPVMLHASRSRVDFGQHIAIALRMPDTIEVASHPLFHAAFLLVHRLSGLEPQPSALVAILLLMAPVPLIAFALFKKSVGYHVPDGALMLFALGLIIMAPITIWTSPPMIGYLNPIVYHNPTSITLRLFVIPVSVLAFRIFQNQPYSNLKHRAYILVLCAVLAILSILAKPSFALAAPSWLSCLCVLENSAARARRLDSAGARHCNSGDTYAGVANNDHIR